MTSLDDSNLQPGVEAQGGRPEPPGETAIVIVVPEMEPIVRDLRYRHDPAAASGVGAHVTVLYPFVAPAAIDGALDDALRELAAQHRSFELTFTRVRRWPEVVYVEVAPEAPIRALTTAVTARWPQHQPYGGAFDDAVPHLTVGHGGDALYEEAVASVGPHLPVTVPVTSISLLAIDRERWTVRDTFPLQRQTPRAH